MRSAGWEKGSRPLAVPLVSGVDADRKILLGQTLRIADRLDQGLDDTRPPLLRFLEALSDFGAAVIPVLQGFVELLHSLFVQLWRHDSLALACLGGRHSVVQLLQR